MFDLFKAKHSRKLPVNERVEWVIESRHLPKTHAIHYFPRDHGGFIDYDESADYNGILVDYSGIVTDEEHAAFERQRPNKLPKYESELTLVPLGC
jgi:hypothetical protein